MSITHIFMIVVVMAAWGGNFVAIKIGLENFPPLLFSAIRFSLTAFPFIFFLGKRDAPWIVILGIGFFLGVAKFSFLFVGMDIGMPAGLSSLILQSQAFFTVLIAVTFLNEKIKATEVTGFIIASFGLVLIGVSMTDASSLTGLVMVVLAGFFWAISNLIMKRAGKASMLRLIVYASLVPPIPLFLMSYELEGSVRILNAFENMSVTTLFVFFYIVVISTLIGFTVWGRMLSLYPAAQVAPFGLLVPIFGITLSAIILGERLTGYQVAGAVFVLMSLLLINGGRVIQIWRDQSGLAREEK